MNTTEQNVFILININRNGDEIILEYDKKLNIVYNYKRESSMYHKHNMPMTQEEKVDILILANIFIRLIYKTLFENLLSLSFSS